MFSDVNLNLYFTVFITGLMTGGLTCLAVQGGLLASLLAVREKAHLELTQTKSKFQHSFLPVILFVGSKLFFYTILGLLLGALGSVVQLSYKVNALMQITVGLFMVISALKILDAHPALRQLSLTTPHFLRVLIRKVAKDESWGAPVFLGFLTIFLPCGTTQAMEVLAIGTQSPIAGALTLFFFVLGTIPLFLFLGLLAAKISGELHDWFLRITALLLFLMGIFAVNTGLVLAGSPIHLETLKSIITFNGNNVLVPEPSQPNILTPDGYLAFRILADGSGYNPSTITVKKGSPVQMIFVTKDNFSCSRGVVFPTLNINKLLPVSGETPIEFTPQETGVIPWSCSMGMYRGAVQVVD